MGIQGLLPFLDKASSPIHLLQLKDSVIAIDAYCWLHKGAFGCAERLARGEETNGYVLYCQKYLNLLRTFGIKPIMVFDGQHLAAKKQTELKRREQRDNAKKRGVEFLKLGMKTEALNHLRRSIDITPKMAYTLIKECRNMGIDCICAPYEADAQLAYLSMNNFCDAVITEDSDLVLFGAKNIIYKLDLTGHGVIINTEKLHLCMKMRIDNYSFDKFQYMCILSGCDYLDSLPGIGLKNALKFVTMTANPDIYNILQKLPFYLKKNGITITKEYRDAFMVALATFKHQYVYDPVKREMLHLTSLSESSTKKEHLQNVGEKLDKEIAFHLALGNLNPLTLEKFDDWLPERVNENSIWSPNYKKKSSKQSNNNSDKILNVKHDNKSNVKLAIAKKEKKDDEEIKKQEDIELDEELKVYLEKSPVKKRKRIESDSPVKNSVTEVAQNVHNPFRKEVKISKFLTGASINSSSNSIVKSKYFISKENFKSSEFIRVTKK